MISTATVFYVFRIYMPDVRPNQMNEECGIFLVNHRKEILLLHQANTHWRKWSLPVIDRRPPVQVESQAAQVLAETTGIIVNPYDLLYIGISRHKFRHQLFHGFYHELQTDSETIDPQFVCQGPQNIDAYRWLPAESAINYLPHHHGDQILLLVDLFIREQEPHQISENSECLNQNRTLQKTETETSHHNRKRKSNHHI